MPALMSRRVSDVAFGAAGLGAITLAIAAFRHSRLSREAPPRPRGEVVARGLAEVSEELRSILIGTAGLSIAGVIALFLAVVRRVRAWHKTRLRATVRLAIAVVCLQATHFVEEFATGFHQRFPELLGLTSRSSRFFVSFNLFWLAIWTLSVWALAAHRQAAFCPLWFLAIGCFANGIAHPLLSMRTGGYFPGLVTSPFVGLLGVLLLRRLFLITETRNAQAATTSESQR